MPAAGDIRPRERLVAVVAVVVVQLGLGFVLLNGLRVEFGRSAEAVERLVEIALPPMPARVPPPVRPKPTRRRGHRAAPAPKAEPTPLGGSPGPKPAHAPPSITPLVAVRPSLAPSGGGAGSGPAVGSGSGGGTGGQGSGDGRGGTDLVQIAGAILPSDYPRDLRERGIGGRVEMVFTVGPNGRVTRCTVTRSSGVAELDALTCRLIEQRFVYRPSTDRNGRPIADEVEGEQDWVAR
jgi:periplasmic protein TonB